MILEYHVLRKHSGSASMGTQEFLFLDVCKHILFLYICLQDCESKRHTFFLVFIMFVCLFVFNYCDCGVKLQSTDIGLNLIPRKGHFLFLHRISTAVFLSSSDIRFLSLHLWPDPQSLTNSLRARCTMVCMTGFIKLNDKELVQKIKTKMDVKMLCKRLV